MGIFAEHVKKNYIVIRMCCTFSFYKNDLDIPVKRIKEISIQIFQTSKKKKKELNLLNNFLLNLYTLFFFETMKQTKRQTSRTSQCHWIFNIYCIHIFSGCAHFTL